jgi:hypothetical protein
MSDSAFLPATVLDRELVFHNPTAIQLALMQRLVKVIDAAGGVAKKEIPQEDEAAKSRRDSAYLAMLEAFAKLLDIIGSLLPDEDASWLSEQMLLGKFGDDDMLKLLNDIMPEGEEQVPPPKKRVRRGQ